MGQKVREIMTTDPVIVDHTTDLVTAARRMRDEGIGDVLVERDGTLCGIVTDRDIVVRAVAEQQEPTGLTVGEIASAELEAVSPDDEVREVVANMRDRAIRRVPVVDDGTAVGILSIGDLAVIRDEESALADISARPSNV